MNKLSLLILSLFISVHAKANCVGSEKTGFRFQPPATIETKNTIRCQLSIDVLTPLLRGEKGFSFKKVNYKLFGEHYRTQSGKLKLRKANRPIDRENKTPVYTTDIELTQFSLDPNDHRHLRPIFKFSGNDKRELNNRAFGSGQPMLQQIIQCNSKGKEELKIQLAHIHMKYLKKQEKASPLAYSTKAKVEDPKLSKVETKENPTLSFLRKGRRTYLYKLQCQKQPKVSTPTDCQDTKEGCTSTSS